jgi:hypothetical protein
MMKTFFASTGSIREKGAIQEGEVLPGKQLFIINFQKFLFPILIPFDLISFTII